LEISRMIVCEGWLFGGLEGIHIVQMAIYFLKQLRLIA